MSAMVEMGEIWLTEPTLRRFLKKAWCWNSPLVGSTTIDGRIPANHLECIYIEPQALGPSRKIIAEQAIYYINKKWFLDLPDKTTHVFCILPHPTALLETPLRPDRVWPKHVGRSCERTPHVYEIVKSNLLLLVPFGKNTCWFLLEKSHWNSFQRSSLLKSFTPYFPLPPPNFFGLKRVIYVPSFFFVPSAPNQKKFPLKSCLETIQLNQQKIGRFVSQSGYPRCSWLVGSCTSVRNLRKKMLIGGGDWRK